MSLWLFFLLRVKDLKEYIPRLVKESHADGFGMMLSKNKHLPIQSNSQPPVHHANKKFIHTSNQRPNVKCLKLRKAFVFQFPTFCLCVGTHPSTQHLIVVTLQGRFNLFAQLSCHDLVWLEKMRQLIVKKVPYLPEEPWKQWDDGTVTQSHELEIWKTNGWNLEMMVSKMNVVFSTHFLVSMLVFGNVVIRICLYLASPKDQIKVAGYFGWFKFFRSYQRARFGRLELLEYRFGSQKKWQSPPGFFFISKGYDTSVYLPLMLGKV